MSDIIEAQNLFKRYKDGVVALQGLSFTVEQGSFFSLLGENGAGKSTAINILSTVLAKTRGRAVVNGHDIDKDPKGVKESIGIVFQNSVLDGVLTVKENLLTRAMWLGLTGKKARERIEILAKELDLGSFLNRRFDRLSGGQKRRADIARGVMNDKIKILFLDEPTTGLDPHARKELWNMIHDLRKNLGLTVFLTTHYMEETEDSDKVVVIDKGELIANGTPLELKTRYATNQVVWYAPRTIVNDQIAGMYGHSFTYGGQSYKVAVRNSLDSSSFIAKNARYLTDFEVKKATMEEVFLNLTGKESK
mgnify:FL=1